jgi:hypothetical protein
MREMYATVHELRGDVRQGLQQVAQSVASRGEGGFTVLGSLRQADPVTQETRRTRRRQADQVRSWLPEESRDVPLGQEFEPLLPMPRSLRRRVERLRRRNQGPEG